MRYPGDVDLLIVPYSDGRLWLSDAVAVEVKIVRASFLKQGRSPNKLGVSQARGLLDKGFPRVAVLHLITSDTSPPEAWRQMARTRILDSEGHCSPLEPVIVDMLPADLIRRTSGRLAAVIGVDLPIGHVATYMSGQDRLWMPSGSSARRNPKASTYVMDSIEKLISMFPEAFINVPSRPGVPSAPDNCEPMILDRRKLLKAN